MADTLRFKIGARCRMYYRKALRSACPHGESGRILLTHGGKRLVRLDSGRVIVCPMWNAVPTGRKAESRGD